jgi:hypothetical protein
MFWIGAAVMLVAGVVALLVVILTTRPADVEELASVSHQWMAQHRVE